MDYIGRAYPRLADTTKRFNNKPLLVALHEVSYVILNRRWFWKVQVLPDKEQEVPKVFEFFHYLLRARFFDLLCIRKLLRLLLCGLRSRWSTSFPCTADLPCVFTARRLALFLEERRALCVADPW